MLASWFGLLSAALAAGPDPEPVATIWDVGSGDTIADACDKAAEGDIIHLLADIKESVKCDKSVFYTAESGVTWTSAGTGPNLEVNAEAVVSVEGIDFVPSGNPVFSMNGGASFELATCTVFSATLGSDPVVLRASGAGEIWLTDNVFMDLSSTGDGGAIAIQSSTRLTMSGNHFDSITADDGGAIWLDGTPLESDTDLFSSCTAQGDGGAIYSRDALGNVADIGSIVLQGGTFTDNVANGSGGDLYVENALVPTSGTYGLVAYDTAFYRAQAGSDGGSLYVVSSDATVADSLVQLTESGGNGGAFAFSGSEVTLGNVSASGGTAAGDGGIVYIEGGSKVAYIGYDSDTSIGMSDGSATNGGLVAIYDTSLQMEATRAVFEQGFATDNGGGLYFDSLLGDDLELQGGIFAENQAQWGDGGGLWISTTSGVIDASDTTVCDNDAGSDGGGIALVDVGITHWTNSRFVENQATHGDGLFLDQSTRLATTNQVTIDRSAFVGNFGNAIRSYKSKHLAFSELALAWNSGTAIDIDRFSITDTYEDSRILAYGNGADSAGFTPDSVWIAEDPQFVDYTEITPSTGVACSATLRPLAGDYVSPLIDTSLSSSTEADPDGTTVDIGAYGGLSADDVRWIADDPGPDLDWDADGWHWVYDCDEHDPKIHPEAPEVCNKIDDDCDGLVDDEDPSLLDDDSGVTGTSTFYADEDGDGFGNPEVFVNACVQPDGYVEDSTDCDDTDDSVHPGADEVCDEGALVDEDCDGFIDDEDGSVIGETSWYADQDGDGYGAPGTPVSACHPPEGYADNDEDCNDDPDAGGASYYPGAPETDCSDPNDYNCDGSVGYEDADGDGYAACLDCDDSVFAVNPAASEVCDGVDNDCDFATDDEDSSVDPSTYESWFADPDGDGWGGGTAVDACAPPEGWVAEGGDCDETSAEINPGASEVCNELDDDCDELTDDEDDSLDGSTGSIWYVDGDADGWGGDATRFACREPDGYTSVLGDCHDGDAAIHPGQLERCDDAGVDEDCDQLVNDEDSEIDDATKSTFWPDDDGDGYGDRDLPVLRCELTDGLVPVGEDCNDDPLADGPRYHPGAEESDCNDPNDYNCDGSVGYADLDQDGVPACEDCDDSRADIYPGAPEIANDGIDQDCNQEDAPAWIWYGGPSCGCDAGATSAPWLLAPLLGLLLRRRRRS